MRSGMLQGHVIGLHTNMRACSADCRRLSWRKCTSSWRQMWRLATCPMLRRTWTYTWLRQLQRRGCSVACSMRHQRNQDCQDSLHDEGAAAETQVGQWEQFVLCCGLICDIWLGHGIGITRDGIAVSCVWHMCGPLVGAGRCSC